VKKVIELLEQAECLALAGSRSAAVSCIDEAIAELKAPPCWETPEQWEAETGEPLRDDAMVLWKRKDDKYQDWSWADLSTYAHFNIHCGGHPERCICLVFTGPYLPPKSWRQEEAYQ
jgi:hypothetical protein